MAKAMQDEDDSVSTVTQTETEQKDILEQTISEHKQVNLFDNGSITTNNENGNVVSTNYNGNVSSPSSNTIINEAKPMEQKKGRGRPRKADTVNQTANSTQQPNGQTQSKTDFFGEYRQTNNATNESATQTGAGQSEVIKNYFTGLLVLTLIDAIAPAGITFLLKKNDPTKKINPKDFKLTDDEMKSLEPLADEVIKLYIGTLDPLSAFIISVIIIYGAKITPHLY